MNDISVFIYFLCFACLAGATFAYMYAMMTSTLREFNRQQERRNVHPEMSDVQSGEELLVFKAQDEESMAKHNREATVISMILGFTTLALFVDGLLRMLGIIPPFMHLDVNILDKIETDIIDRIKQVPIQKILQQGFR